MSTGSIVKVVNTKAHNADENKNISQKHLAILPAMMLPILN